VKKLTAFVSASMPRGAVHPEFAPEGTLLRYEVNTDTFIWAVARTSLAARFQGGESAWSRDSRRLAFVRDGKVFVGGPHGENSAEMGSGHGPAWHPDGKTLFWVQQAGGQSLLLKAEATLSNTPKAVSLPGWSASRPWILSPEGRLLAYVRAERHPGQLRNLPKAVTQVGAFPQLLEVCVLDLTTGEDHILGRLTGNVSFAWAPIGRFLAYATDLSWDRHDAIQRLIFVWQEGQQPALVDAGNDVCCSRPSWSPDGKQLAFLANPWGRYTWDDAGWLTVYDAERQEVRAQFRGGLATTPAKWSPDGNMLYCRLARHVEQPYAAISVDGEYLRALAPERHYCSSASLSPDGGTLAVSARSFHGLNEIWLCPANGGTATCITSQSQVLEEYDLPELRVHQWETSDGRSFEGLVVEPRNVPPGTPILLIPGADMRGLEIALLELNYGFLMQWMAQQGFRVFMPSHRATCIVALEHSTDQWRLAGAAADVVAGVRSLQEHLGGQVPVVMFGQSFEGDLGCEILVSHPDVAAAAVVSGVQPEFLSVYGIEGAGNPTLRAVFGGPPWERPEAYLETSPMRAVGEVSASVLIMMGAEDTSCPSAERFYVALKEADKDATFLKFRGQAHWPETPRKVAAYVQTAVNWLQRRLSHAGR
jgi:dipeptidyl aminopeptidase/acylaminoacyl peptidase